MNDEKKVRKAIERFQCVHCDKTAVRRRRRKGTQLDVPLCDNMKCLRAEWTAEDTLALAKELRDRLNEPNYD